MMPSQPPQQMMPPPGTIGGMAPPGMQGGGYRPNGPMAGPPGGPPLGPPRGPPRGPPTQQMASMNLGPQGGIHPGGPVMGLKPGLPGQAPNSIPNGIHASGPPKPPTPSPSPGLGMGPPRPGGPPVSTPRGPVPPGGMAPRPGGPPPFSAVGPQPTMPPRPAGPPPQGLRPPTTGTPPVPGAPAGRMPAPTGLPPHGVSPGPQPPSGGPPSPMPPPGPPAGASQGSVPPTSTAPLGQMPPSSAPPPGPMPPPSVAPPGPMPPPSAAPPGPMPPSMAPPGPMPPSSMAPPGPMPPSSVAPPGPVPPSSVAPPGPMPPSSMAPPGPVPPSSMAPPGPMPPSSMAPPGPMPPSSMAPPGPMPPSAMAPPGPMPPSSMAPPGPMPPSSMAPPGPMPPSSMAPPGPMPPSSMAPSGPMPPSSGAPPGPMPPRSMAGPGHMPTRPMGPPGSMAGPGHMPQGPAAMNQGMQGTPTLNGAGGPPPGGMQNRYPGAAGQGGGYPGGGYPGAAQGQSRRLNPDDMPSPLQVTEEDRRNRSGDFITNIKGQVPPLVTTNFVVKDGGNASPRFLRSTMYSIPATPDMIKQTSVPFSLVVSPLADQAPGEAPPYQGTVLTNGPVRCNRCKAYMGPLMQFIDGGRRYQCMLCRASNEVPSEYFCHLDQTGQRTDKFQRAELCLGAYEYAATPEYCRDKQLPKEPAFIFVMEMSQLLMQRRVIPLLCQNMRSILEHLPVDVENGQPLERPTIKVGFITYDSNVHFYKLNGQAPEMCVLCDRETMFVPVPDGILCDAEEVASNIDKLMECIPQNFHNTRENSGALACALQAGMSALQASGRAGKLFVFHSSLPQSEGGGKLKNREDRKLLGTEKEKNILSPNGMFYNNLGQDLVSAGCGVDLFIFNDSYVDLATIGQVARLTGGQCHKYTYFQADKDGPRFLQDLKMNIKRNIAFDAVMRVRTSTGVRPVDFFGHFFMSNTQDIELACVDSSKAIAIEIKHDDKLTEEDGVYIQAALLFTSCSGKRRLRILNLALNVCSQMADLYKNCDLDTMMNFFGKQSVVRLLETNAKQVKENLIARTAQILACYRKHCASPSSAGQLILPELMKLLPLYVNCLSKCDAVSGGQDLTCDERSLHMYLIATLDVAASVCYFYPRLLCLSDADPQDTELPPVVRTSYEKLRNDGVFLLENGISIFIWVGSCTPPEWMMEVFGVSAPHQLDPVMAELPELDNPTSSRTRGIIASVRSERKKHLRMFVVPQQGKHEMVMRNYLVEDKGVYGTPSYVDFLCHVHKEIRAILS